MIELRARLAESEEALRAIRSGEVDAVLGAGRKGRQIFTLEGAEHAYRVLIESMNEGALTLTAGAVILYANQCFARMVKCPLEQVIGSSLRRFLSGDDRAIIPPLLKRAAKSGSKVQIMLHGSAESCLPVQISIRPLAKNDFNQGTFGLVLTDMTEARRNEERLRELTQRIVQVQEAERGRIALELHDNITQLLCAVLFRSEALAEGISPRETRAKREAVKLREMLGKAVQEVERISRNLRPGMLEHLGLVEVIRASSKDFAEQNGVLVRLNLAELATRLPADTELALYRILQEALKNVAKHAQARHVAVGLNQRANGIELTIGDDGVGFATKRQGAKHKTRGGLGLLGMRERATYVGGTLEIKSARRTGTEITVRIPTAAPAPAPIAAAA